jgi:predicted PurR-regulated permease PerM
MLPLNTASRIGLSVLLFLAGAIALRLGESFLVPLLISLLLATVLGPMAWWFHETLKIRWSLSCVVVIIGLIAANALVALVFSTSVMRLVNQFSNEAKVIEMYNNFRAKLENMSPVALDADLFPNNPQTTSQIGVLRHITDAAPYLLRETASITGKWSWQLTVILFITFFVMLEGRMLARRAAEIFGPSPEIQHQVSEV